REQAAAWDAQQRSLEDLEQRYTAQQAETSRWQAEFQRLESESAQREQDWECQFGALTVEKARWEADRQKVEVERQNLVEELEAVRATLEAQQQALVDEVTRRRESEAGLQAIRTELNELRAYVAATEHDRRAVPVESEAFASTETPLDDWNSEPATAVDGS